MFALASPGDFSTLPTCAAVSDVQVIDVRTDKALGRRFMDDNAATVAPVSAASDVAAWVRAGVLEAPQRSGVSLGKPGAPVLRIAVEQIRTNENVVHRSGYDGRIVISAKLSKRGSGSACWSERADGQAENYRYTGSVESYQETLNHALDRTMIRLINIRGFRRAVCSCGG